MDIADRGYLDGASLTTWSGRGQIVHPVDGPGEVVLTGQSPAWTVSANLHDTDGRSLASGSTRLRSGLTSRIELTPREVRTLTVELRDPDGVLTPGYVTAEDAAGTWLGTGYASSGQATIELVDVTVDEVTLHGRPRYRQPLWTPVTAEVSLTGRQTDGGTLAFGRYELTTLSGTVTLDGAPAGGLSVQVSQSDRRHSAWIRTAEDGSYTLSAYPGEAVVTVSRNSTRSAEAEVVVPAEGLTDVDLAMTSPTAYQVAPHLLTQYTGQTEPTEQSVDWPVAYHFGHPTLNTSADWISWRGDPTVTVGYPVRTSSSAPTDARRPCRRAAPRSPCRRSRRRSRSTST